MNVCDEDFKLRMFWFSKTERKNDHISKHLYKKNKFSTLHEGLLIRLGRNHMRHISYLIESYVFPLPKYWCQRTYLCDEISCTVHDCTVSHLIWRCSCFVIMNCDYVCYEDSNHSIFRSNQPEAQIPEFHCVPKQSWIFRNITNESQNVKETLLFRYIARGVGSTEK